MLAAKQVLAAALLAAATAAGEVTFTSPPKAEAEGKGAKVTFAVSEATAGAARSAGWAWWAWTATCT